MGQGVKPHHAGDKHRFLLELWLEPREFATRVLRLRGRMHNLTTDTDRSVAGISDIDGFIRESFTAGTEEQIGWAGEP